MGREETHGPVPKFGPSIPQVVNCRIPRYIKMTIEERGVENEANM